MPVVDAPIEVERACARLAAAFAYCVDHQHYEDLSQLFTEDGVFERPGMSLKGREEIRAAMAGRPTSPVTRHICGMPVFTAVSADQAEAVTPLTLYQAQPAESGPPQFDGPAVLAEYIDRFQRTPQGWKIAERRVVVAMVKRGLK